MLVARRPHLARPKTQYVLAKDPELPPLPVLDSGYGALSAVQGPAPAPLEGEDIFVSDEDPNAKRPRITQGRIDAGASRNEWFEHDGLHCTSFGSIGEACTRCVGGAAVVVGAASRSTVAISAWLVLLCMATGEGGSLPSLSMVLRRGGLWGESSLILYYCYFWLQHRDSTAVARDLRIF